MANAVDVHIGSRVRRTRDFRGMTQPTLARALGIAAHELDQLERGVMRFTGCILVAAGKRLGVDATFFFRDLEGLDGAGPTAGLELEGPRSPGINDNLHAVGKRRERPALAIVGGEARGKLGLSGD